MGTSQGPCFCIHGASPCELVSRTRQAKDLVPVCICILDRASLSKLASREVKPGTLSLSYRFTYRASLSKFASQEVKPRTLSLLLGRPDRASLSKLASQEVKPRTLSLF